MSLRIQQNLIEITKVLHLVDNWLDDIDWVKVKKDEEYRKKYYAAEGEYSSEDEDDPVAELPSKTPPVKFDSKSIFKEILAFMLPGESITKTLQRMNKLKMNISSAQRWKMKKQGKTDDASDRITKLTGLTNEILQKTGNMNVYDLTFDQIQLKLRDANDAKEAGSSKDADLDMYADDFDVKEKAKIIEPSTKSNQADAAAVDDEEEPELMWEVKVKADDENILGPFNTLTMSKKADNGDFKDGAVVRKVGDERFYSAARIDFELYL